VHLALDVVERHVAEGVLVLRQQRVDLGKLLLLDPGVNVMIIVFGDFDPC
jgi:hypothetical protein